MRMIVLLLLLSGPSFAASVNSSYTCVQGHEQDATAKLRAFAIEAATKFFKGKDIEIDPSTLNFNFSLTTQTKVDGAPYVGFTGNAGGGLTGSALAGTIAAKDGTKFNVLFSSGSDNQDMGEYRIVGTQSGFDQEGNPINGHCRLSLFNSGDSEATKTLLVLNAGSGHIMGLISLPAQIPLYWKIRSTQNSHSAAVCPTRLLSHWTDCLPGDHIGRSAMNRRNILRSLAVAGIGAGVTGPRGAAFANDGAEMTKRFEEQRWALDNIIHANGVDWDQPRSIYLSAPCGVEAGADFAAIRARVQKMADIGPVFESTATRREAKARAAEAEGNPVTARDNWYMAAIHYGAAEWPYDDSGKKHIELHAKKRECFANYARLADHKVEAVSITFKGKSIPGWFHLPPGYTNGSLPVVISIPGMDSFKEASVALTNDRFLSRGVAVLAIDGPGQYESPLLGVFASMQNWIDAGPVVVDWLLQRPEVDREKIGVTGVSFGSFFSTIISANEPRIAATAVMATCLEPGFHTIFEEASPTFKKRFMWMSNFTDEAKFNEFAKTLTWEGHAEKIRSPYLVIAGEADELSPLEHTERMIRTMTGPRQLIIYAGSRHSVGGVPATNLGPFPPTLIADWLVARLGGKTFKSEQWFVDPTGRVVVSAL